MLRMLFALLLISGASSSAYAYNGLDLLQGCNHAVANSASNAMEVFESGRCMGYISGVVDANTVTAAIKGGAAAMFCVPDGGLQNEQLVRVVVKYLTGNPEQLHHPARMSVIIALRRAFPCR